MSKETNAERLERVKHNTGGIYCMESESVESKDVPVEDFDWLIEQAERTQSVEEENARLRKVLAFYADGANWSVEIIKDNGNKHRIVHIITGDSGQKALKALECEG